MGASGRRLDVLGLDRAGGENRGRGLRLRSDATTRGGGGGLECTLPDAQPVTGGVGGPCAPHAASPEQAASVSERNCWERMWLREGAVARLEQTKGGLGRGRSLPCSACLSATVYTRARVPLPPGSACG